MAEANFNKLNQDVEKFLVTYNLLAAEAKAAFEAQLAGATKDMDDRTKKLYGILLDGAKNGLTKEQTIAKMREGTS